MRRLSCLTLVAAIALASLSARSQPVASVAVSAAQPSILVDSSTQLTATVRDSAGNVLTGRPIAWSVDDAALASVSPSGLLTGVLPGRALATATVEGVTGSAAVTLSAPTLPRIFKWFTGHFSSTADDMYPQRATYGWGYSMYVGVHPVKPNRDESTQLGWGNWMQSNPYEDENNVFKPRPQFTCPPPTTGFYDVMEGGAGTWANLQFPTAMPKYTIQSSGGCVDWSYGGIGGPAYYAGGFSPSPLPQSHLWFAQLSNRVILPPDRVNFEATTSPKVFGLGWLALPVIPANTSPYGVPTGPNTWTLVFNAANFHGPVGFFTPSFYTAINAQGMQTEGYGLDARPAIFPGPGMEIGFAPSFESIVEGVRYRRVPRITLGAGPDRRAMIAQDYTYFSKAALWDQVAAWMAGGPLVTSINHAATRRTQITTSPAHNTMGFLGDGGAKEPVDFSGLMTNEVYTTGGGAPALGLAWDPAAAAGVIPEYYRKEGGGWKAIAREEVPRRSWLEDQSFPSMPRGAITPLDTGPSSPWAQSAWAAGPFTTKLADGSVATYVWYRFVDQPAIKRLNLDAAQRAQLQAWAASVHGAGSSVFRIAPPSEGTLASIDPGHLVMPPAGLEAGYVPIVIAQELYSPPRLGNISTRMQVLTGNDVMIGGFVIGGSASKTVAIVATGPSLAQFGIANALANPTLRLVRSSDQQVIATNDDWKAAANQAQLSAAGFAPTNPLEAAILVDLPPGAYTAIVEGVGGGTGVAVVAVYEVDGAGIPLVNISTRGRVLTGNDVMIGGFVIQGSGPQTVAIVATGPSLAAFGITNPLANPTISLVRSSDQVVLAANDDWQADANAAQLQAGGFAPTVSLESGLYRTLPPGAYTVIVQGAGGGTGVSVIGVYKVN